jgi:hypothetical protein
VARHQLDHILNRSYNYLGYPESKNPFKRVQIDRLINKLTVNVVFVDTVDRLEVSSSSPQSRNTANRADISDESGILNTAPGTYDMLYHLMNDSGPILDTNFLKDGDDRTYVSSPAQALIIALTLTC